MTTTTTWTKEKLVAKTRDIFTEQLGVDEDEVTPDSKIMDDLGADSLDFVELIIAFEETFNLEITDEDAEKLSTVGQVNDYLARRMKVANK